MSRFGNLGNVGFPFGQLRPRLLQRVHVHLEVALGGGAALVGKEIAAAFPRNAEIVPQPALANATGFARFAQRRIFRADRS